MSCLYIAGAYTRRAELQGYAAALSDMGHHITSGWLQGHTGLLITDDGHFLDGYPATLATLAEEDRADIRACDILIGFTEPLDAWVRGTTLWEIGFADGLGKGLVLVGARRTLFDWLPGLCRFETWEDCAAFLRVMREEGKGLGRE